MAMSDGSRNHLSFKQVMPEGILDRFTYTVFNLKRFWIIFIMSK